MSEGGGGRRTKEERRRAPEERVGGCFGEKSGRRVGCVVLLVEEEAAVRDGDMDTIAYLVGPPEFV